MNADARFAVVEYKLDDMEKMANAIAKSGLFGVKEPLQALALMLMAQAEGQHPATIAQDYDIIQGRAARKTHSVLARFQKAGGKVKWIELTDTCAKAEFSHPDGGSLVIDWTIARAKSTTVWNSKLRDGKGAYEPLADRAMYKNYPRAMLRARVIAEGIRAVYPAAIGGMLVAEEAVDIDEIDVTPARPEVEQPQPKNKPKAVAQDAAQVRTAVTELVTPPVSSAATATESAAAQTPDTARVGDQAGGDLQTPAPAAGQTIEQHTLAQCLAVLDENFRKGSVQHAILQIEPWRSDLAAEDLQKLDATIEQLVAEQESVNAPKAAPAKKLMIDGQKRILRARLKSNNKTIAQLEAQFGGLDTLAFDQFEEAQKWITG